jgi:hypothetical protein
MKDYIQKLLLFMVFGLPLYLIFSLSIRYRFANGFHVTLKPNKEYVVMGNSHPECALNDSIAQGMSNWALSGENCYYGVTKLRKVLADNPHVKCVAIEWSPNQFGSHMHDWIFKSEFMEKESRALSFLFSVDQSYELFHGAPLTFCKSWIMSDQKYLTTMMTQRNGSLGALNWGGFKALKQSKVDSLLHDPDFTQGRLEMIPNELNLRAVQDWLKELTNQGVHVVFFRCPIHPSYGREYEDAYQLEFKKWFPGFKLMDFQNLELPNHCFYDLEHLNEQGAKQFTPLFDSLVRQEFGLPLK